jgi:carbon-monoxide dehydrogenase large subunit
MVAYRVIGRPTPRVDGVEKVTGDAHYTADVALPGTLWGKALHSPYAHARIVSVDTSRARALPGVHAVITGADIDANLYGRIIKDIPVLARDRVRFVGDRVAAVAADDEDIAQQALELIDIEYEELPAVFEPFDALEEDAPILHPDYNTYAGIQPNDGPTNAYSHTVVDRGDVDAAFAAADVVVENEYHLSRVHQVYLEPQAVLISVEDGRAHVWATSKAPFNLRESLANAVGITEEDVVVNPTFIGGDFGGKGSSMDLPICYYLARASGRPVRMVLDYLEEFLAANPRHEVVIRLKTGVMRDGTLTAHQVRFVVNCGAYAGYKPRGSIGGAAQSAGPYRIPNTRIESMHVYTNTVPGGHMRAPGEPQAVFAIESQIDEVARAIGMDPVEFRRKNLVTDGEETPGGHVLHEVRGIETLDAAVKAADYTAPKAPLIGRGAAIGDRAAGGGQGNSAVTLHPDGTVLLSTPIFDQGTGTYTTLCQVVAEELQVAIDVVDYEVVDTDAVRFDSGIGGSRGTRVNTAVAYEAAQDAKRELFALASERLGWPADRLVLREGEIRQTDLEEAISWSELLQRFDTSVTGRANVTDSSRLHVTSFVAQVAEVEVDPDTGEVKLLKFTTAHDVGRVMNPIMHQGQVNGGFMQGLGYALMEELRVEDGRVTSLSFGDYKVPTARDIPPLTTVVLESESGTGPYNIKGIGETPLTPVAPAIANAIEDAVGVRIRELPITAEKVYQALQAKDRA